MLLASLCPLAGAQISHVYDELGRLVQTVTPDGNSVQYKYDAAGNVTDVKRIATGMLALTEFTPNGGVADTVVTLYGSGFSTVLTDNIVKFNGKKATVQADPRSSANLLVVKVPTGATTGRITLTNAGGSVTSSTDFMVGANGGTPQVTAITPDLGKSGDIVRISGANFLPYQVANGVVFGQPPTFAQVVQDADSPTATLLKAMAPPGAHSGPISVSTRNGKSADSADFFAVPGTHAVADVLFKARVAVGGAPAQVSIPVAGKKAVLIFDGSEGQYLNVATSGGTFANSATVEIYRQDGTQIESFTAVPNSGAIPFTKRLPSSGTYTLVFFPRSTEAGSIRIGISHQFAELLVDAPSPTLVTVNSEQVARVTFTGQRGKSLQLLWTDSTIASQGNIQGTEINVYRPDGGHLAHRTEWPYNRPGAVVSLAEFVTQGTLLPSDGIYLIEIDPAGSNQGQVNLHLKSTNSGSPVGTDGAPVTVGVAAQQLGNYSFPWVAGRGLGVSVSDLVFTPASDSSEVDATFFGPDGRYITTCHFSITNPSCKIAAGDLVLSGTYGVAYSPGFPSSVSLKATLNGDASGELLVDAQAPTAITLKKSQNARYTFSDGAGEGGLLLLWTENKLTDGDNATDNRTKVTVLRSNGSPVTSAEQRTKDRPGVVMPLGDLPRSTIYTVLVEPSGQDAGPVNLQLKRVGSGAVLRADGTSTQVTVASQGLGHYSFPAVAGAGYTIRLANLSITPGGDNASVNAYLYGPDGTQAMNACVFSGSALSCTVDAASIKASGTYGLVFAPSFKNSATFDVVLDQDAGGTLQVDADTPTTVVLRAGQKARYKFAGTQGQNLQLLWTGNTLDDLDANTDNIVWLKVYAPNGDLVASRTQRSSDQSGWVIPLTNLPATGDYSVEVVPGGLDAGQLKLHLRTANSGAVLLTDGSTRATSIANRELAYYSFNATAATGYGLMLKGLQITPGVDAPRVTAYLYRADGSLPLADFQCVLVSDNPSCDISPAYIDVSGRYGLVLVPSFKNSASFEAQLYQDATGTLQIDAAQPTAFTLPAGQNGVYTFSGGQNDKLQLLWTENALNDGSDGTDNWTSIQAEDSNGGGLGYGSQPTSDRSGMVIPLEPLGNSGTFRFVVSPSGADKGQFKLQLKTANSGPNIKTDGTPFSASIANQQLGYYSFTAVAGKPYTVVLKSLSITPGANDPNVIAQLYAPNGSYIESPCTFTASATECVIAPTLFASSGKYGLVFVPKFGNSATFTVVLTREATGVLTKDATSPTTISLAAGQKARYTFTTTTTDRLQLLWTNNALDDGDTGTDNYTYLNVYKSDGTKQLIPQAFQRTSNKPGKVVALGTIPADTYTVTVDPDGLDEGQFKLHLRTANSGTSLPVGGPSTHVEVLNQELGNYRFTGTSNKAHQVTVAGLEITPGFNGPNVVAYLFKPDGSDTGASCTFTKWDQNSWTCTLTASQFATNGEYGLVFVPKFQNDAKFDVTVTAP